MSDTAVRLKDDSANTGRYLDHEEVTFGAAPTARDRPRVRLAGAAATDLAPISTRGVAVEVLDRSASGTLTAVATAAEDRVILDLPGCRLPIFVLTGTLTNASTVVNFQYDPGNGVWKDMQCLQLNNATPIVLRSLTLAALSFGNFADGIYKPLGGTGMKRVRVYMSARGGSDSINV